MELGADLKISASGDKGPIGDKGPDGDQGPPGPGADHDQLAHLAYADAGHSGFAPTSHTHAESDVTSLVTDLAGKVPTTRTISTTAPLTGGGDLSADRTLAVAKATASVDGYLDHTDFATFNGKQSALTLGNLTAVSPLAFDATRQVSGGATQVSIPKATSSVDGYLDHSDWDTFNAKANALSGTSGQIAKFTSASAIGDSVITESNGKVGIGTTGPNVRLEVAGQSATGMTPGTAKGSFGILNEAKLYGLYTAVSGTGDVLMQVQRNDANTAVYNLLLQPSGGYVGIGTTGPGQKLSVAGNVEIQGAATDRYIITDAVQTGSASLRIQAGVGSAGYGGAINLFSHAHSTRPGSVVIGLSQNATGAVFAVNDQGLAGGTDVFTVLRTGNVGIGTASPGHALEIGTDDAYKPTSSTWGIVSDRRIKTITGRFHDGLNIIREIGPVWYRYNGLGGFKDDGEHIGVIAQEIMSIAPYMIEKLKMRLNPNDSEDTELLGYQGHALPFILLNAIKELDQRMTKAGF